MVDDQLRKMHDEAGNYFLLSFTLTQKVPGVFLCPAAPSIIDLADRANGALFSRVLSESSKDAYPKLLFIDNLVSSDIIPLAMGINYKVVSRLFFRACLRSALTIILSSVRELGRIDDFYPAA